MILLSVKFVKKFMNNLLNKEIKLKCTEKYVLSKFETIAFHSCIRKL